VIRSIFGIIFHIVAGLTINNICVTSFMNIGAGKVDMMVGYSIPTIVFLLLGVFLYRRNNWKTAVGITLLSGTALSLFTMSFIIAAQLRPDTLGIVKTDAFSIFNDYFSGFLTMGIAAALGIFLFLRGKLANKTNTANAKSGGE